VIWIFKYPESAMKRAAAKRIKGGAIIRSDGRRATTMYLKPEVTAALKRAAIDEERSGYEIVEEAVMAYLKKPKRS
jgi:hypothetical protein